MGYYSIAASLILISGKIDADNFSDIDYSNSYIESTVRFPVIKINDFAVDKRFQRNKIGTKMMFYLFNNLYLMYSIANIGMTAITLQSKNSAVEFYKKFGFKYVHKDYNDLRVDPFGNKDYYPMMIGMDKVFKIVEESGFPVSNDPYNP
ncbi:hypothetical protein WR164_01390 [Philodulcilactobacillus myokoensis]|uniref:N-acetyltransferase domain-containing protein n=1 Tax=Philodulcilactobacillus myokoensis TaxID=2929573 RepID=A0A9W6ERK1_9LACO|nr:GNAT family N-acetyltransferase [Philodulcilactobacillus myokoensis]GLB46160.1 hypothetical protein WR164_01390 [Philodulcilactobacillus myokoensis]